jgi:imidazolonepropionase-like amidohydrolase
MVMLTNARIFDGRTLLPELCSVSIADGRIAAVSRAPVVEAIDAGAIDLRGMTLMPGMISCHFHPDFFKFTLAQGLAGEPLGTEFPPGVMMAIGIRNCATLLESGFTGYVGASCSNDVDAQLKIAIAEGIVPGPRIRACSQHIGTTGDLNDSKNWWKRLEHPGTDVFFDGPAEMRKIVRESIRRGAQTIKIFASRGHGFPAPTARNMDRDEIETIVNTAHARGAKVRAHVAERAMIVECIDLGVDILDHGDWVDEEIIDRMAAAGTYWVPSLIYPECLLKIGWGYPDTRAALDNVRRMLPIAQSAGIKILIGDDYSGVFRDVIEDDPLDHQAGNYAREFAYYAAIEGLAPEDVLSWGTANAGELLAGAGETVGEIAPGAVADLIVVDGDPVVDLTVLAKPWQALKAVIRDGKFVIDRLGAETSLASRSVDGALAA